MNKPAITHLDGALAFGLIPREVIEQEKAKIRAEQQANNIELEFIEGENIQGEETQIIWNVPIPTRKEFISNKQVDYRILGGLYMNSNSNAQLDFLGLNDRGRRYIMGHKMDAVVEDITNTIINPKTKKPMSKSMASKHIRILKKLGAKEFSIGNFDGKLYYDLQFGEVDEEGTLKGGDFVTIPSYRLRALVNAYSSNSIKVYTTLLWKCWNNKKRCFESTHVPYETLMEYLGINDRTALHDCLWALEDKFITINKVQRHEHIFDSNGAVRSVLRVYNYYNIIEY
jgi:hypothetical protein